MFISFDLQAFRFLVKPVADEKLKEVLENAVKGLERSGAESGKQDYGKRMTDILQGPETSSSMTGRTAGVVTTREFLTMWG